MLLQLPLLLDANFAKHKALKGLAIEVKNP